MTEINRTVALRTLHGMSGNARHAYQAYLKAEQEGRKDQLESCRKEYRSRLHELKLHLESLAEATGAKDGFEALYI